MCSTQFHSAFQSVFSFSGEGFFSCKCFVGDVIKAVSIVFLFNWGDLKSMFVSSWGCNDIFFEGLPNMLSGQLLVLKCGFLTGISTQIKEQLHVCNLGQSCHTVFWHYSQQYRMVKEENYLIVVSEAPTK